MLENTFISNSSAESSSSSSSIHVEPIEILIKSYEALKKYPNINHPNRYPRSYKQTTDQTRFMVEYHDLIFANAVSLIPNIDIGYQQNLTSQELERWITNAKSYFKFLTKYLNEKCDEQYKHFQEVEKQKLASTCLKMEYVEALPDDLIHKIHSYLLPETRIILLTAKYPDYMKRIILKHKNDDLKKILSQVIEKKYYRYINRRSERIECFPNLDIRFTFKNKETFSTVTKKLLDTFMKAPAKTPELYQEFQTIALRLLQFLVYNGAYQEKPKPVKKPTKKSTKKVSKKT